MLAPICLGAKCWLCVHWPQSSDCCHLVGCFVKLQWLCSLSLSPFGVLVSSSGPPLTLSPFIPELSHLHLLGSSLKAWAQVYVGLLVIQLPDLKFVLRESTSRIIKSHPATVTQLWNCKRSYKVFSGQPTNKDRATLCILFCLLASLITFAIMTSLPSSIKENYIILSFNLI